MGANNSRLAEADRRRRRHRHCERDIEGPLIRVVTASTRYSVIQEQVAAAVVARRRALLQIPTSCCMVMLGGANNNNNNNSFSSTTDAGDPKNMPLLYSLARSWAWGAVTYRCQTHPDEADAVDCFGDTVLHWSVFGRPPVEAIQAILAARPGLAQVPNKKGHLPLHVACSYRASGKVLAELLRVYPQAAGIAAKDGSYPLHLLCDYGCPVESFRFILQIPAGIDGIMKRDSTYKRRSLEILNGRKNLHEFQRMLDSSRKARKQQRAIRKEGLGSEQQRQELNRLDEIVDKFRSNDFWQKAAMLSLVEHTQQILPARGSIEDIVNSAAVLRACVGNPLCPSSIQEFAILLNDDKLGQPDENGNLPLHIAAGTTGNASVVRDLVNAYPEAARFRNKNGDLPLSILLRHPDCSWKDGIGSLLKACPSALVDEALDRRLYPLVWARLSSSSDMLYESIRSQPDLFRRQTSSAGSINSVMA